jgi:amino acid efflux transporter
VLATTAVFVAVYLVAGASAIRLLKGGAGRAAAVTALALAVALAAFSGWYLLWPVVLAAAALAYLWRSARRRRVRTAARGRHRRARTNR